METYYEAWLAYCKENSIELPSWEGDRAWEFHVWMTKQKESAK